jgi:hypothetical protein
MAYKFKIFWLVQTYFFLTANQISFKQKRIPLFIKTMWREGRVLLVDWLSEWSDFIFHNLVNPCCTNIWMMLCRQVNRGGHSSTCWRRSVFGRKRRSVLLETSGQRSLLPTGSTLSRLVPRIGVIYSQLFKYTQHTAGFTENNWTRTSQGRSCLPNYCSLGAAAAAISKYDTFIFVPPY